MGALRVCYGAYRYSCLHISISMKKSQVYGDKDVYHHVHKNVTYTQRYDVENSSIFGDKKYPVQPDISWWAIEDSNLSPPQRQ